MPDFGQGQANSAEILQNKTIDAALQTELENILTPPHIKDTGVLQMGNGAKGYYGILANPTEFGTYSYGGLDTSHGQTANYTSSTTANTQAGLKWVGVTQRNFNPYFRVKIYNASSSAVRFVFGLFGTDTAVSSDTILGSGIAGVVLGFRASDTNWQVFNNDSSGPMATPTDTGVAKAANVKVLEIISSSANIICRIDENVVATLTTDIPVTTTMLALHCYCSPTTTTAKTMLFYNGYFEHKRTLTPL